ncbi:MAG: MotA/TolQ/ExbB proton channel family protein, partial [Caldimicrobium sp.]
DIPKMASNMVTAFTTTVVGLSCGVLAYLMSMIKERWVREDMREMEYWTEKFWRKRKERTEEYIVEDENGAV